MTNNDLIEISFKYKEATLEYWFDNTFLRWEWWVLIALTIIPWIVWWKFVDKKRIYELLTYGF